MAERAVSFFEQRLRHAVGRFAGQPFLLAPFERSVVRDIFGSLRADGTRRYRTVYLEIAKKNGKTAFAAGLSLQGLAADGESEPHVYCAATTRDQAALVYAAARSIVRRSGKLAKRCLIRDSTKTIVYPRNQGFLRAISADADVWDGIQPSRYVADELHRWGSNRDLLDVLEKGAALRCQPLGVLITTAGVYGAADLCWELHEQTRQAADGVITLDHHYGRIWSTPLAWDWTDPGQPARYNKWGDIVTPATGWYAANPALGHFLPLDKLLEECAEARKSPRREQSFRRFRLNQWVQQEERWISLDKWDACAGSVDAAALAGRTCYAGLDLSQTKDLTALVLVFPCDGRFKVLPFFWLPREYHANQFLLDKVRPWVAAGLIETSEGPTIKLEYIRERINDLRRQYAIREIGYDPWSAGHLAEELAQDGFKMVEMRQGFATLSGPSKQMEALVLERRIEHGGHRVLRWNVDCATVRADNKDNILPVKPNRQKSSSRVDGVLALVMALDCALRRPEVESVYEHRGVLRV